MGSAKALHARRYQAFIARLRLARQTAGLTQEELGRAMGRSQTWISKCELGERRVDPVEAHDFATALRTPLSWFLDTTEE